MSLVTYNGDYGKFKDDVLNATGQKITCACSPEDNTSVLHFELFNKEWFKIILNSSLMFPPKHHIENKKRIGIKNR